MDLNSKQLADLICGMRRVYALGENAMAHARDVLKSYGVSGRNHRLATLIAYDLQAGTYVQMARADLEEKKRWCRGIADLIEPLLPKGGSLLEVGVGEATTLAGVLAELSGVRQAYGFDISWSRINVANDWLREQSQVAELFVGDLLNIPLADNSIDVVYSSHSLEPNGGREEEAIAECLRVARKAVVLIEPLYELASQEAQTRMRHHGYVRGLRETAERLGAEVIAWRLLDYVPAPLNPSGVLALRKTLANTDLDSHPDNMIWQCPLTKARLIPHRQAFAAVDHGIVYPVFQGVPLLRASHALVASRFDVSK